MKKYTSNYAKNKDINENYISSNTNSRDMKPVPMSSNNTGNYFTYKDYENKDSFSIKQFDMVLDPINIKHAYNKK